MTDENNLVPRENGSSSHAELLPVAGRFASFDLSPREPHLYDYLLILRKHQWLILSFLLAVVTMVSIAIDGNFMTPGYRMPNQPIKPGEAVKVGDTHPATALNVKLVEGEPARITPHPFRAENALGRETYDSNRGAYGRSTLRTRLAQYSFTGHNPCLND